MRVAAAPLREPLAAALAADIAERRTYTSWFFIRKDYRQARASPARALFRAGRPRDCPGDCQLRAAHLHSANGTEHGTTACACQSGAGLPMLSAIFRLTSFICLAIALVAGVLDLTRSIADRAVVMTPLAADWMRFSPDSLASVQDALTKVHPWLWSPGFETLASAPSWAVFAGLSLFFAAAVRTRKRRWQENFGG
jgi:hypothetical protein